MTTMTREATAAIVSGRYALFFNGRECGVERWWLESVPDGYLVTGDQELLNDPFLAELLAPCPVHPMPFLGDKPLERGAFERNLKKLKRTLKQILG